MDLKCPSCPHTKELPSKVAVLLVTVIQSADSHKKGLVFVVKSQTMELMVAWLQDFWKAVLFKILFKLLLTQVKLDVTVPSK